MSVFGFFAFGVHFEVGLEFGDRFLFLLHLLGDLGEGIVSSRVVWLGFDSIFGTKISAWKVVVAHIELCDAQIFVYTFIIGLNTLNFREFAMD